MNSAHVTNKVTRNIHNISAYLEHQKNTLVSGKRLEKILLKWIKKRNDGKNGVVWNTRIYLQQIPASLEKLDNYFKSEQKEDYTIVVHAMKGNLSLIGAETLSETARTLEMAEKIISGNTF